MALAVTVDPKGVGAAHQLERHVLENLCVTENVKHLTTCLVGVYHFKSSLLSVLVNWCDGWHVHFGFRFWLSKLMIKHPTRRGNLIVTADKKKMQLPPRTLQIKAIILFRKSGIFWGRGRGSSAQCLIRWRLYPPKFPCVGGGDTRMTNEAESKAFRVRDSQGTTVWSALVVNFCRRGDTIVIASQQGKPCLGWRTTYWEQRGGLVVFIVIMTVIKLSQVILNLVTSEVTNSKYNLWLSLFPPGQVAWLSKNY